jgi:transposase
MSLRPQPVPSIPEETARVARAAFPKGHLYLRLRDAFETFFTDDQFAALFPTRGQPAEAPWRLALVSVLQFAENLSDRQAADAVRGRIDWKYLLALPLTDPGFDFSLLSEFRDRLVERSAELLLFEGLLRRFQEEKLVKAGTTQRTDATHVLAAVRSLNRLELVGESMRAALNAVAVAAPAWVGAHSAPEWIERYGRRFADQRLPKGEKERTALAETIGQDGAHLLSALDAPATPGGLRELPEVAILRTVWEEQFVRVGEKRRFRRPRELPPAGEVINSPYDPQARYGKKRETEWIGYKVHVTETCEPAGPIVITDVQTSAASLHDSTVLLPIQQALSDRGLLPATHLTDAGYVEGRNLLASQEQHGVELVGPVPPDASWQTREPSGLTVEQFAIDWERQEAYCPAGQPSRVWREYNHGQRGRMIQVEFAVEACRECPQRSRCTRAEKTGRVLRLQAQKVHEALRDARQREQTQAYVQQYRARAGVEGTHAQAVRRCGLRQCRYVGEAKVHLQHLLTATALNFVRVGAWLMESPRARTRESAFVRTMAAA